MPMTPEAKALLAKTVRELRARLLAELGDSLRRSYKLGIADPRAARLGRADARRRARLDAWIAEQIRALPSEGAATDHAALVERFRLELVEQAAHTLLNRLVFLRLLEGAGLRSVPVLTGGWRSPGYRDFRELAPELLGDASEGYALLLQTIFDELALDLPGLYARHGLAELVPTPADTLRAVVEALDRDGLESCWTDDMTLGWVYQYWNDPEREALDAKLAEGGKLEHHEIASKTQMFTERYMVDWLLQNSFGPMWLAMCKRNGWVARVEQDGTLARLERRRVEWRRKRDAGEVSAIEPMPIAGDEERRWAYYLPQAIPDDAVAHAPASVRMLALLDPALGSGHFLVVAFDLLLALHREEAAHRGETWTDREIVESILTHNLHGIDLDPRAVQIAAAALWLKAMQVAPDAAPSSLNLVASQLRLAGRRSDDPALVELREAVERDTGLPAELTDAVVHALAKADHLGSLLKVEAALAAAIEAHASSQPSDANHQLLAQLERFLAAHTSSADLGLRLRGRQLAAGVRLLRMLREGTYDLVVGNPPYQNTAKIAHSEYVRTTYRKGKADLYAAFLIRGLELARPGGTSAMLTMRTWMFLKQYKSLRLWLLESNDLRALGDFDRGAFEDLSGEIVSVAAAVVRRAAPSAQPSVALRPTAADDRAPTERTARKRAATLCQVGRHEFETSALAVVAGSPVVYWWDDEFRRRYARAAKLGEQMESRFGVRTSNNKRFIRMSWEVPRHRLTLVGHDQPLPSPTQMLFAPHVMGASGRDWFDTARHAIRWDRLGLEICVTLEQAYDVYPQSTEFYFRPAIALPKIGSRFRARTTRFRSVIDCAAPCVFPDDIANTLCVLNGATTRAVIDSINPTINLQPGDLDRIPLVRVAGAEAIVATLARVFAEHEAHRETSVEFRRPGPSAWASARAWAQLAVDRPEGAPLPAYVERLEPEPASDHLSFAVGVALGRFGDPARTGTEGVLDPTRDDLSHALPDGILYLDGTLAPEHLADGLGHPSTALLRQAWASHAEALTSKRSDLRDWLRLELFDLHRGMYENRPIYWPLSSDKRTFVAWINIHRWHAATLRKLVADHLNASKRRLEGEIVDLRGARDSGDRKAAHAAQKRLAQLERWLAELLGFIARVHDCAERGPPPPDTRTPVRERDATYEPDLDDGVMVNASALWPLLHPQWRDPRSWWTQLAQAKGRKDYDWSQLAARYFPTRVEQKCRRAPSLALAHRRLWKYHPARAYAWELRLQDDIGPEFTIDESWDEPHEGVIDSTRARAKFVDEHAAEVEELRRRQVKRRERKLDRARAQRRDSE